MSISVEGGRLHPPRFFFRATVVAFLFTRVTIFFFVDFPAPKNTFFPAFPVPFHVPPGGPGAFEVATGRVVDERGHPLVDATVRALAISMASRHRRLLMKAEARTDGRGVYRLHSLWPAGYLVCASAPSTAPLDDAQRLQLQGDRARRSAGLATGPAAAAAEERLAALEAQLPARIAPVRGYAPACHRTPAGARTTIAIGPGVERAAGDLRLGDTRLARVEGTVAGLALGPDQDAVTQLLNRTDALGDVPEAMRATADGFATPEGSACRVTVAEAT